jgi:hypothetical protein
MRNVDAAGIFLTLLRRVIHKLVRKRFQINRLPTIPPVDEL